MSDRDDDETFTVGGDPEEPVSVQEEAGGFEQVFLSNSSVCSPAIDPVSGNLLVCTGSGVIMSISDSKATVYAKTGGQPSHVAFDSSNRVFICDIAHNALLTIGDRGLSKIVENYDEKAFLGPTSAVVDKSGVLYFTDSGAFGQTSLMNPKGSVFAITGGEHILQPIALGCLAHPSALALSPDNAVLYVAETCMNRILRGVEKPKGVFHFTVFHQFTGGVGPVALAVDAEGNLLVGRQDFPSMDAAGYISVLNPQGKLIGEVITPAPEVTGIAYDNTTNLIYITEASTRSIFKLPAQVLYR